LARTVASLLDQTEERLARRAGRRRAPGIHTLSGIANPTVINGFGFTLGITLLIDLAAISRITSSFEGSTTAMQ
jgi:hypothetical protein